MKATPLLKPAAWLLVLSLFTISCSKQGPAGATGAQGPSGPQGSQGAQGPKGDTGVANIIYSAWNNSFSGSSATWTVSQITQGVLDSAVVLVYVDQGGYIFQLPYDNVNGSGFYINDLLYPGEILLYVSSGYNLNQFSFRWVIIPPGVPASTPKNYSELTRMYNISF